MSRHLPHLHLLRRHLSHHLLLRHHLHAWLHHLRLLIHHGIHAHLWCELRVVGYRLHSHVLTHLLLGHLRILHLRVLSRVLLVRLLTGIWQGVLAILLHHHLLLRILAWLHLRWLWHLWVLHLRVGLITHPRVHHHNSLVRSLLSHEQLLNQVAWRAGLVAVRAQAL